MCLPVRGRSRGLGFRVPRTARAGEEPGREIHREKRSILCLPVLEPPVRRQLPSLLRPAHLSEARVKYGERPTAAVTNDTESSNVMGLKDTG